MKNSKESKSPQKSSPIQTKNDNSNDLSYTFENHNNVLQTIESMKYSPVKSKLKDITEITPFASFTEIANNYIKLAINLSGSFYINRHSSQATTYSLALRDAHFINHDNAASHAENFFFVFCFFFNAFHPKQKSELTFSVLNTLVSLFPVFKDIANNQNNSQGIIKIRNFLMVICNSLIFPNKEAIATFMRKNPETYNQDYAKLFTLLNEHEFSQIVDIFSITKNRKISLDYIYHHKDYAIPNFNYLLEQFHGWNDIDFIKEITKRPIIINQHMIKIYETHIKNMDDFNKKQIFIYFNESFKNFINNKIAEDVIFYFIDNFFSDTLEKKLLAISYSAKYINTSLLLHIYPDIPKQLSENPKLLENKKILFFVSEIANQVEIQIKLDDLSWSKLFNMIDRRSKIINFRKVFGVEPFLKNGYSALLNNSDNKISHIAENIHDNEIIPFMETHTKHIKSSTNEDIANSLKMYSNFIKTEHALKIHSIFHKCGYFDNFWETINTFQSIRNEFQLYLQLTLCYKSYFELLSSCFNARSWSISSRKHKEIFAEIVQNFQFEIKETLYVKSVIELKKKHPIHCLLDNMIDFYSIENNAKSSLTNQDFSDNETTWESLKILLDISEKFYSLLFLQQTDIEGVSIRNKLVLLDQIINMSGKNPMKIDAYKYSNEIKVSNSSKILFWKKDVYESNMQSKYLYINPQGLIFSDDILPDFFEADIPKQEEISDWKAIHEEQTKIAYTILKHEDIPTEISLRTKDLIRNFKKIAESIEPIKEYLDFEEVMFFEQSFFQDIISMLKSQQASSAHEKVLKNMSLNNSSISFNNEQQHSLKIIELLQKQMDNISQDMIISLKNKSDFDLQVLAQYVSSRTN